MTVTPLRRVEEIRERVWAEPRPPRPPSRIPPLPEFKAANTNQPGVARPRFDVVWFDDISEEQTKEYLIEGALGVGEFTAVVGKPGSGKSVVIGDAACHVAAGRSWHGRDVKQGLVVYFAAERKALTQRRMTAFRKRHGIKKIPLAVVGGKLDLTSNQIDALALVVQIDALEKACGMPCVWVIFDTLSRTFGGGDQNSTKDMGRYVQSADEIGRGRVPT